MTTVLISLNGTCICLYQDGWREAMSGTIALYDRVGERLHTIYLGTAHEYGNFANQEHRIHFEHYREMNFSIDSRVTEAACKTMSIEHEMERSKCCHSPALKSPRFQKRSMGTILG